MLLYRECACLNVCVLLCVELLIINFVCLGVSVRGKCWANRVVRSLLFGQWFRQISN